MVGTLPPTYLLLTRGSVVHGTFKNLLEVAKYLKITVSDEGVVMWNNTPRLPIYIYDPKGREGNAFHDKEDIIRDWMRCHFRVSNYVIHRAIR